jgi:GT2 family glycosyltransferase
VKVAVAIVTYRWARALPYSLTSVDSQTRKPEEEVIALKPSGDSSEEVMRSFSSQLPIKLVVQEKGNFTNTMQMAIDNAKGNVILFLDDAVAEERWVENTKTYSTPCPTSAESAENHTKHISRAVRLSKLMSPSTTKNRRETHFIESRYRNT